MMKDAVSIVARVSRMAALLALAVCPLLFTGCNAGTAGLVIYFLLDDDDDSGSGTATATSVSVSFLGVQNNRTSPSDMRVGFRLTSENRGNAELRVEFSVDDGPFETIDFVETDSGRIETDERGPKLTNLLSTPDGVAHEFVWDAVAQLGTDDLSRVTLRLISGNELDVPVLVGNDAPTIEVLEAVDQGDGNVSLELSLHDETSDPADVELLVSSVTKDPSEEDFAAVLTDDPITSLPTSPTGAGSAFLWRGREQLGALDRIVLVRVIARDLVGQSTERASAPRSSTFLLDLNSDPIAKDVTLAGAADDDGGDRRRGLGVSFLLEDREGDEVDVFVQWAAEGEEFPALPMALDFDPASRQRLLQDPEAIDMRWNLQIATLRPRRLSGPVEFPADAAGTDDRHVLATWLLREESRRGGLDALRGRGARLVRVASGDGGSQERVICGYDPSTGLLQLNEAFDPAASPGDRLEIDLAGPLRLSTEPSGSDAEVASTRHHVVWASDLDVPGGGPIRVRVTPFDRAFAAPDDPMATCRDEPPFDLEGALPGDRGLSAETGGSIDLRGPFGERGAWTIPLAPVDDPAALAVADIDEDGRLDVAAVSAGARSLVLSFQTAPGSFDRLRLLDERIGDPTDVVVADLDGDDDLDIAVTNRAFSTEAVPEEDVPAFDYPGSVMVYLQNDDLDFIPNRKPLRAAGRLVSPEALAAADFDGDGSLDLAVGDAGDSEYSLTVFFSTGGPGAAGCDDSDEAEGYRSCSLEDDANLATIHDLVAVDVDDDGDVDLIAAAAHSVVILVNDGSGEFSSSVRAGEPAGEVRAVGFVDINVDGISDLLAADPVAGEVLVLLGEEDGSFTQDSPIRTDDMIRPEAITVVDVDANGSEDVLIADSGSGEGGGHVTVCLADASGGITCDSLARGAEIAPQDLAVGDFDLDGLLDIASIEGGAREVAIYLQEAPGTFQSLAPSYPVLDKGTAPTAIASGDVDGDGYVDLVVSSATSNALTVLRQGAGGSLEPTVVLSEAASGFSDVELSDINGDGRVDLVAASLIADLIEIRYQGEDGSWDTRVTNLTSDSLSGLQSFATGDLDGDGRLDLVAVGRFSETVVSFLQSEDGSFTDTVFLDSSSVSSPIAVALEDLGGDGRLDTLVASHTGAEIVIADADPKAALRTIALPKGTRPVALRVVDVDGDGDQDVLVAADGGSSAVLRAGDGGEFDVLDLSGIVDSTSAVGIAELDADLDGRLDLVLTSPAAGTLEVLRGDGEGGFALARTLGASDVASKNPLFTPSATLAIDLDGDGESDLVTTNRSTDSVVVFWGGR